MVTVSFPGSVCVLAAIDGTQVGGVLLMRVETEALTDESVYGH